MDNRHVSRSSTPTLRLYLPRLHSTQQAVKAEAARFNVLDAGRRSGKNVLGIDRVIEPALYGYPNAWFAPTYKYLAESWRDLKRVLAPVIADKSEQEHRLMLHSGGVIECWSLDDDDPARGRKYRRVVVDEAALVKNLLGVWEEAIRPTLTDYAGDGWFLSTPKGLNGFWQFFQRGQDPANEEWRSWKYPTSCNPHIAASEIEAARNELPERVFAQEYLAEFLSDNAGVFRGVADAATLKPQPYQEGHAYVVGVDWGKLNDFTVFSVIDATTRKQAWKDRFNKIDYTFQSQRLQTLAKHYHPRMVIAERNSIGEPQLETIARMGIPVMGWTATNATKAAVIEGLSLAIEQGQLELLDDPVQTGELLAYDAEKLPSGLTRYSAPEGQHDDCVIALALAWEGARQQPQRGRSEYGFHRR
jgi:hypothetical protein